MKAKVNIDNTRFIFDTNFSGDPNRDRYGSSRRRVNVVIPTKEQAQQLIEMGLNVKQTKPNPNYTYDEPFVPTFYVPVTVNMDSKWPPQVFWITTTGRKVACNAENIGQLDYIRVKNVNLQANLYENRNKSYRGCIIENLAAKNYSIPSYLVNVSYVAPDIIEQKRRDARLANLEIY